MIIYLLLILILLLILWPALFSKGGIMLLDYVLSDIPKIWFDQSLGNNIFQLMWGIFWYAFGSKIILVGIHFFSGLLGILFARYIAVYLKMTDTWKIRLLECVGMIFFLTNPFAYERMMTQPLIYAWIIAIGYGLYFQIFRERYIAAGFSYAFSLALFPHASYMIGLIFLLSYLLFSRMHHQKRVLEMLLPILFVNLNWILITLVYNPIFWERITQFTLDNFRAFATQHIEPLNVFFTTILLYGFWGEQFDSHFAHIQYMSPYWYLAGGVVISFVVYWWCILWKLKKRKELIFIIVLSFFSILFAVSTSYQFTDIIRGWLTKILPFWNGYREPEKWTWMVLLSEGILLLFAFGYIFQHFIRRFENGVSVVTFFVMVVYIWSPGVYIAYRNQMRTSIYPDGFFSAREVLRNEEEVQKILILPWYSYIGCTWISRPSIANPGVPFFSEFPLVVSERIDVGKILGKNNNIHSESNDVEKFLSDADISNLKKSRVSHIILLKSCYGSDEQAEYLDLLSWLSDIHSIFEDESINIYTIP